MLGSRRLCEHDSLLVELSYRDTGDTGAFSVHAISSSKFGAQIVQVTLPCS
jgi:hypothetical protein